MPSLPDDVRRRFTGARTWTQATPARRVATRIAGGLFALWLLLALFAWLAGPALITRAATGFVEREFAHRLVIRDLRINPLKLAVTVEGLSLGDADGREIVGFRAMVVDVDVTSLLRAMAILDEFRLDGLTVNVERLDADRFNFSDLADRLAARFAAQQTATATTATTATAPAKDKAAIYFLVRHLDVSDAALRFADHTRTPVYESWMRPLNLRVDDLTSRPDSEAPYSITATLGTGGTVSWEGDLSLEPLRSQGAVTLSGFGLSAAYDYVKDAYGFALPEGTLDARIGYFADFAGTQSVLRIDDGSADIKGLALTGLDGTPLFAFDSTRIAGLRADIMKSTASLQRFETRGGRVNVMLDAQGVSNIERALVPRARPAATVAEATPVVVPASPVKPATAAAPAAAAKEDAKPAPAWQVEVSTLAVLDYALSLEDRSTTPAVQLQLTGLNADAGPVKLPELPAIPFTVACVFAGSGGIDVKGRYTLDGGVIDADITLRELPLAPVSPYLARVGRFSLTGGTLRWQGKVQGRGNLAGGMQVRGDAGLRGIALRDDLRGVKLAKLDDLAIDGIDYDDAAVRLGIRTVTVAGLDVDVAVDAKGISNLQRVMTPARVAPAVASASAQAVVQDAAAKETPAQKTARKKKEPAEKPLALRLDALVLRDGRVSLRDDSPDMAFIGQVSGIQGRIEGLSTDARKQARVQVEATLNRYAPLSVSGTINPLAVDSHADLQVRVANLDLGALTPYTVTWVAYPLARGTLGLELDWKVADRKFSSTNHVVIRGLALGDKQPAPRALKVPVKLGMALLTNRDGDADLEVPAFGDLDDPQFRYGRVILKAFGNLLTRAATAPFAALGSFGGGDKPDIVVFAPGSQALADGEREKLGKLARTLADKPLLTLAITGTASVDGDRAALQRAELERRLRVAFYEANKRKVASPEQVVLDEAQRLEVTGRLYKVGTGQSLDALRDAAGQPLAPAARIAAAEAALLPGITVEDVTLRELARGRSQAVKDALLAAGIAESRLVVVDGKVVVAGGDAVATALALEAH